MIENYFCCAHGKNPSHPSDLPQAATSLRRRRLPGDGQLDAWTLGHGTPGESGVHPHRQTSISAGPNRSGLPGTDPIRSRLRRHRAERAGRPVPPRHRRELPPVSVFGAGNGADRGRHTSRAGVRRGALGILVHHGLHPSDSSFERRRPGASRAQRGARVVGRGCGGHDLPTQALAAQPVQVQARIGRNQSARRPGRGRDHHARRRCLV